MIRRYILNPAVLYLLLTVALFWRVFFLGETLVATDCLETNPIWGNRTEVSNECATDTIEYYYPNEVIYSDAVKKGGIPLWNPHIHCGKPIPHGVHLYVSAWPVKLAFLALFSPDRSYNYYAILHFWLAALALYFLARETGAGPFPAFAAGLVYVLCGRSMAWLHVHYLMPTMAYAPLVFLFILRGRRTGSWREFVFAAIPMTGLAYTNPHAAVAMSAAILFFAPKRGFATIGLAVLASAIILLPLQELVRASERDPVGETDVFYRGIQSWTLLLTLFNPEALGEVTRMSNWGARWTGMTPHEYASYLGLLPIVLIIFYLRALRTPEEKRFAILGGIALAVATLWPLPNLLMRALPFLFVSIPTRFLFIFAVSGCVLFALALERLRLEKASAKIVLVAILLLDLLPIYLRFNRTHSPELLSRAPPAIAFLQRSPGRVAYDLPGRTPPFGIWGIDTVQGYDNSVLRAYVPVAKEFGLVGGGRIIQLLDFGNETLDWLGVRFAVVVNDRPMPLHWRRVYRGEVDIYENTRAQPLARVENGRVSGEEVETSTGGRFDWAVMNYHGWEARLDGVPASIEGVFLSVQIPPGRHRLTFEFRPGSVRWGTWISAFGIVLILGMALLDPLIRKC